MTFKLEGQLREAWKKSMGLRSYFVEPAMGSTFGLTDVFSLREGQFIGSELKRGNLEDGILRFKVRPSQRNVIPGLIEDGGKVLVSVAEVGTGSVHVFPADFLPGFAILSGKVVMEDVHRMLALELDRGHWADNPPGRVSVTDHGTVGGLSVEWKLYGLQAIKSFQGLRFKGWPGFDTPDGTISL